MAKKWCQFIFVLRSQGNLSLITSLDGSSNIVNQVQRVFNGLGQLTGEYQSHSGAVVQGTTPEVQYAYTEMSGGQNNSRLVSMTYPHGYTLEYNYNTGLDSNISRLSSISDSNGVQESYKYLGLDTVVERDHPQSNVNLTYIQQTGDPYANTDGGDQYTGLDRFGRIIDQFWINASNATTVDRYQYGYNQDGDVLDKQNLVNTAMSELYTYDNLNQLTSFQRGTLNSTHNGIVGSPSRSQSYTPDALGNFSSVTTNGTAQTRTANQQNEITSISGQNAPTYDANGNTTADGTGNTYVYDAWNRLVTIQNNGTTVESYRYDGLNRQIQVLPGAGGSPLDLYVSSADQVLEEYQDKQVAGTDVWSPVYVNALVMRIPYVGSINPTQYVIQDANWNVTALVDTTNDVLERYAYDPYGAITVMSSSWVVKTSSAYNVPYGFQGMRYDWTTAVNVTWARVYDPTLMRWLQADPLGLGPDNNCYRLEGNGPADSLDPSGLKVAMKAAPPPPPPDFSDYVNPILQEMWESGELDEYDSATDLVADVAEALGLPFEAVVDNVFDYLDTRPTPPSGIEEQDIADIRALSERDLPAYFGGTVGGNGPAAAQMIKDMLTDTAVFVGSVMLPGPEDLIMAGLASKYSLQIMKKAGKRVWGKLVGKEVQCITEAEARTYAREWVAARRVQRGEFLGEVDRALLRELNQGTDVVIPSGSTGIVRTMTDLTLVSGNEVAFLRLKDGTRVMRMGGPRTIKLGPEVERVIAHTHPRGTTKFSAADIAALQKRGQRSSVLIDPRADMAIRLPVPP